MSKEIIIDCCYGSEECKGAKCFLHHSCELEKKTALFICSLPDCQKAFCRNYVDCDLEKKKGINE